VTLVEPTGSAAVEIPPTPTVTVPNVVVPAVKVIVPVGSTPVEDVTFAVNVTVWPDEDGLAEELIVVVVEAAFTTCSKTEDVLGAESLSPSYSAVSA
jgi:hypothetical protein